MLYRYRIWEEDGSIITDENIMAIDDVPEMSHIKERVWTIANTIQDKMLCIFSKDEDIIKDFLRGMNLGFKITRNFDAFFEIPISD